MVNKKAKKSLSKSKSSDNSITLNASNNCKNDKIFNSDEEYNTFKYPNDQKLDNYLKNFSICSQDIREAKNSKADSVKKTKNSSEICSSCSSKLSKRHYSVGCSTCNSWFCLCCADLSIKEVIEIKQKKIQWKCGNCIDKEEIFDIENIKEENDRLKRHISNMNERMLFLFEKIENLEKLYETTKQNNSKMQKDIKELKEKMEKQVSLPTASYAEVVSETKNLKNQIDSLNNRVEIQATCIKQVRQPLGQAEIEPTILEMQEREKRALNVLIFGVEESKTNNKVQSAKEDCEKAVQIIKRIKRDIYEDSLKCCRIGVLVETKQRPIKVTFPTKEDAIQILRLKNTLNIPGVYIKYDQTTIQRDYLKNVINELEERKQRGETNIRIKYFNTIPKIVTDANPKN